MNSRTKQLSIAILIGLVAIFGNQAYLSSRIDELKPDKFIPVVRAKKAVSAGTVLTSGAIQKKMIPANYVPKAAIKWADHQLFLGQEVGVDILPGDYVLESYFSSRSTLGRVLSEQLDGENMRAISLPVDETNSLARSIVTGDHIDIMFTFIAPELNQKVSLVLLQNVPVISTGTYSAAEQEIGARAGSNIRYNILTLRLNAQDAMRLNYARQAGSISLLLRKSSDSALVEIKPITGVQDLLSAADKELLAKTVSQQRASLKENSEVRKQLQEFMQQSQSKAR